MKQLIRVGFVFLLMASPLMAQIDMQATKETKALYRNLKEINQRGIMFGQQDATAYGIGWNNENDRSDIKSVCGDYPAIYGWELANLEFDSSCNLDSVDFNRMRRLISEAYSRGGINTISWHTNNPEGGNAWMKDTKTAVNSILPGGIHHYKYCQWLNRIAAFFLSLRDDKGELIPIIFRPFHEHTMSWFWWGEKHCSPEAYSALWQYTVCYLRDTMNVHNLLYAYSPNFISSNKEYLERYPGNDCVDILGLDGYQIKLHNPHRYMRKMNTSLKIVTDEAKARDKVAVLSETGFEGIPVNSWWTSVLWKTISKYPITYVLVWRNAHNKVNHYYAPYPGQLSADDFIKLKNDERTLFQQDIKNMYR